MGKEQRAYRREFLRGVGRGLVAGLAVAAGLKTARVKAPSLSEIIISKSDVPIEKLLGRPIGDAIAACDTRRQQAVLAGKHGPASPLEELLDTRLSQSTEIGLVNAHLVEEDEMLDWYGPFLFPASPLKTKEDGRLLWFTNNRAAAAMRKDSKDSLLRMEDRAIWAIRHGVDAMAVIEVERDDVFERLPDLVTLLAGVGVRAFVVGNETDDPHTPWRNDTKRLRAVCEIVDLVSREIGGDYTISLPAGAYFHGDGEYNIRLMQELEAFGALRVNADAFHYYGPVDKFSSWVDRLGKNLHRVVRLKHYLTEVGNPGPDLYQKSMDDRSIAQAIFHRY